MKRGCSSRWSIANACLAALLVEREGGEASTGRQKWGREVIKDDSISVGRSGPSRCATEPRRMYLQLGGAIHTCPQAEDTNRATDHLGGEPTPKDGPTQRDP